jgi:hypothetical protein
LQRILDCAANPTVEAELISAAICPNRAHGLERRRGPIRWTDPSISIDPILHAVISSVYCVLKKHRREGGDDDE